MVVATGGVREGAVGCLVDEIPNLVEPTERRKRVWIAAF
jgi:hypothetical protein